MEFFKIGHGNKFMGVKWYAYGTTLRMNMVQRQVYHLEGYNLKIRHSGDGEVKFGCLDKSGYWLSEKENKGWTSKRPPWAF